MPGSHILHAPNCRSISSTTKQDSPIFPNLAAVQPDRSSVAHPLQRLIRAVASGAAMDWANLGVQSVMTCSEARAWLRGAMHDQSWDHEGVIRLIFARGSAVLLLPFEQSGSIWARLHIMYLVPVARITKFTYTMPIWVGYVPRLPAPHDTPIPRDFQ